MLGGHLLLTEPDGAWTGEVGAVLVDSDVVEGNAVGASSVGDGVDATEDTVADGWPVRSAERGVDAQFRCVTGRESQVGGMYKHLGRDTPPIHASAAEGPRFSDPDVPTIVLRAEDGVAGASADDQEVVMGGRHASDLAVSSSGERPATPHP